MAVTESLVKTKLKIKIGSKGVRVESEKESCKYDAPLPLRDEGTHDSYFTESKKLNMKLSVRLPMQGHSRKRGPDTLLDSHKEKKRKMDRSIKQQCCSILKDLMTHKYGWAFNQPVDPVAYNIPDYFTVITKPMDLGTIKLKLEDNLYSCADQFATDVHLTFTNCMSYNPPNNDFHCMAKELGNIFNRKWKLLEGKLRRESRNIEHDCFKGTGEVCQEILQPFHKISPPRVTSMNRKTMSIEEKQELREQLNEILRGKSTEKFRRFLKKFSLCRLMEGIDVDINAIDDEILWEMKRMVNRSLDSIAAEVEPAKVALCGQGTQSRKVIQKGTNSGAIIPHGFAHVQAPSSTEITKCCSCGSLTCQCARQNDLSSERVSKQDHCGVSGTDSEVKKSDSDSNGVGSVVEENACLSGGVSICSSTTVTDEADDGQLSPKKALRAAMLKSRFAHTIFKAKQKTLLDQGNKVDPVKSQREKEMLEKQQHEETASIEAQIRAAEAASRIRAEAELKMQRQKEREAARIALQEMEKTVEIDDNLKFLKDLEMLSQSSAPGSSPGDGVAVDLDMIELCHGGKPLECLGLYIKEDFVECDDNDEAILNGDGEEGEIIS